MLFRPRLHLLNVSIVVFLAGSIGNISHASPVTSPHDDGASIAAQVTVAATTRGTPYTPHYHPELTIRPAAGEITIDALLEDPGWRGAAVANNFAEHNPGDQTRPEVDTEVLVTYDENNLYLAWICYDDPAAVRASLCQRDEIFNGDYVILALDTYGENAMGYEISANPYGIQGDLFFSISRGEDITYDMIFQSEGRITPYGYVVEMAIPFSEMRFPQVPVQEWHVDFWRNRPRDSRYQYSWAAYDRNESCWPCQWGTVKGATGIKGGSGLELLPSAIFHQAGSRDENGRWDNHPVRLNPFAEPRNLDLGLGISYDLSSEFTAEAAINPDFSQVESDEAQIDINSTFALFYPEKRPFFQEGSDLFITNFNAVYTRSINDPIAAAKITGRKGKTSLAMLSARDDHSVIILPFEESSEFVFNGKSTTNILRLRQEMGDQTFLGAVATDRRFDGGGSGTLGGLDGKLRLTKNDAVSGQVLFSHTTEVNNVGLTPDWDGSETFADGAHTARLDGETFDGHAAVAGYERNTSNFGFEFYGIELSPTFRADTGFEPANNVRSLNFGTNYQFHFENEAQLIETLTPRVNGGRKWNFDGTKKDEWVFANLSVNLRKYQANFHAQGMMSNELFHGIQFDHIWQAHISGNLHPGKMLQLSGNYNYGHRIARGFDVMGKETTWGLWFELRPGDQIILSSSLDHASSKDVHTNAHLFSDTISRTQVGYQATRKLSLRLIMQYRDHQRTWDADPLLTYRINALSAAYLGSTRNYRDLVPEVDGAGGWRLMDRQYFVKLQYLFRI